MAQDTNSVLSKLSEIMSQNQLKFPDNLKKKVSNDESSLNHDDGEVLNLNHKIGTQIPAPEPVEKVKEEDLNYKLDESSHSAEDWQAAVQNELKDILPKENQTEEELSNIDLDEDFGLNKTEMGSLTNQDIKDQQKIIEQKLEENQLQGEKISDTQEHLEQKLEDFSSSLNNLPEFEEDEDDNVKTYEQKTEDNIKFRPKIDQLDEDKEYNKNYKRNSKQGIEDILEENIQYNIKHNQKIDQLDENKEYNKNYKRNSEQGIEDILEENIKLNPKIDKLAEETNIDKKVISDKVYNETKSMINELKDVVNEKSSMGNIGIEDFMTNLVQPLLKDWIDSHLPSIVEKIVTKEIKKITN
jgi:uncharacterized protein